MAFGGDMPDFRLPQNCSYHLGFPMPSTRTENHQLYVGQRLSFSDTIYPWHTNQVYHDHDVPASVQVTRVRTPPNLGIWSPFGAQPIVEVSSSPSSPPPVDERHGNNIISASYSVYESSQDAVRWDSRAGFGPPRTLWPDLDRQHLISPVDQETSTLWHHFPSQSSALPSLPCSSHVMHAHHSGLSDNKTAESYIPHHSPPHQSFSPTSPYCSPHPTSSGSLETNPYPHLSFYRVPYRDSTGSSHRRRAARAIEHNGLWVDEDEPLQGLMERDGKLNVHQCRYEEGHTPCHLWIRGDKSSINTHIQRWHRGQPGGDKVQANCRWSACGKSMLKESIPRHIVSVHLGEMWECQGCGKEIARNDAYGRHTVKSNFEACRNAGALITYSADAREINARVALNSGGRLRYAET